MSTEKSAEERTGPVAVTCVGALKSSDAVKWVRVRQYALALLPIVFTAMSQANFVFAAAPLEYRCAVPECESAAPSVTTPPWWPAGDARCSRPRLRTDTTGQNGTCTSDMFTNVTDVCHRWIYAHDNTIVSEFDLACQEWKRTLVGTVHNVGVFISMPMMGYVSDRWGRRTAIIISSVGLVTGALKTLARGPTGYLLYLALEMLEAIIVTATYTTAFVLMLELMGDDNRIISSTALGLAITLGDLILALVVWRVPYWRHFQLIIYCPALLFISYLYLLDESVRWLLTSGKKERAKELVVEMCGDRLEKMEMKTQESGVAQGETEEFSVKLLFSSKILLKRLLVCSWWWFSAAFVYYGLIINSVSLPVPGSQTGKFALVALAAVPGDFAALFALDRIGRRGTLLAGFIVCGLCCVTIAFIPNGNAAQVCVYVVGRASITACFNTIYMYTSELMPTCARGSLVGACSMVARLGSVLAPLTPLLSEVWWPLPTVLFGCVALSAAGMTLRTPDTLHTALPDTVAHAEAMR